MEGRDYGEVVRDGRLAAELEVLDGIPRLKCPYCKDAMGVRSKAIRARSEFRFYFDHLTARHRETCTGRKGHSPQAIVARRFGLCKEGALHKAFKGWVRDSLDADPSYEETKLEERWWDIEGVKWRQPDVQTLRDGQRWAIEVQLSTTFVHVTAERMVLPLHASGARPVEDCIAAGSDRKAPGQNETRARQPSQGREHFRARPVLGRARGPPVSRSRALVGRRTWASGEDRFGYD